MLGHVSACFARGRFILERPPFFLLTEFTKMNIRSIVFSLLGVFALHSAQNADAASHHATAQKPATNKRASEKSDKGDKVEKTAKGGKTAPREQQARAEKPGKAQLARLRADKARAGVQAASFAPTPKGPEVDHEGNPLLQSAAFMIADQSTGAVLLEKNSDSVVPIASITKLMTAMVVLDGHPNLAETMKVSTEDVDTLRGSSSHLPVGVELSREDMLRVALMSSENRAASALARYYPGGLPAFVVAMNRKAQALGLRDTHFSDSTGLNSANVSSARDLVKMVSAASRYPLIREFSTTASYSVALNGRPRQFNNTNGLVKSPDWQIGVSKTGFINESGKCLVMQAWLLNKPVIIVLLDSFGRYTRVADAQRVKRWLESAAVQQRLASNTRGPAT